MTWHVRYHGRTRYLSADELRESLSNHEIPCEALVWRQGMETWRRASDLDLRKYQRVSAKRLAKPASSLAVYIGFLAAIVALSFSLQFTRADMVGGLATLLGAVNAIAIFGLVTALLSVGTILLVISVWKHQARHRASVPAGIVLCIAACAAFLQSINFASFLIASHDTYRALIAIEAWDNAEIIPIEGGVKIAGSIGGRLMRDFHAIEAKHGPVRLIEITSEGGLIDQALQLAYEVKNRNITVIVRKTCLSACVLVAVASPESYADESALFGFHRTYPVAKFSTQISKYDVLQRSEEARSFLSANGVPNAILIAAEAHGPESMHLVTAREMVKVGAIAGIVSENILSATGLKQ